MRPSLPSYSPPDSPEDFEGSITPLLARPTPLSRQQSEPALSTAFSRCEAREGRAWSKMFPGSSMEAAIQPMDISPGKKRWTGDKLRRKKRANKEAKSSISEESEEGDESAGSNKEGEGGAVKTPVEVETEAEGSRREKRRAWNRVTGLMSTLLQRGEPRQKVRERLRELTAERSIRGGPREQEANHLRAFAPLYVLGLIATIFGDMSPKSFWGLPEDSSVPCPAAESISWGGRRPQEAPYVQLEDFLAAEAYSDKECLDERIPSQSLPARLHLGIIVSECFAAAERLGMYSKTGTQGKRAKRETRWFLIQFCTIYNYSVFILQQIQNDMCGTLELITTFPELQSLRSRNEETLGALLRGHTQLRSRHSHRVRPRRGRSTTGHRRPGRTSSIASRRRAAIPRTPGGGGGSIRRRPTGGSEMGGSLRGRTGGEGEAGGSIQGKVTAFDFKGSMGGEGGEEGRVKRMTSVRSTRSSLLSGRGDTMGRSGVASLMEGVCSPGRSLYSGVPLLAPGMGEFSGYADTMACFSGYSGMMERTSGSRWTVQMAPDIVGKVLEMVGHLDQEFSIPPKVREDTEMVLDYLLGPEIRSKDLLVASHWLRESADQAQLREINAMGFALYREALDERMGKVGSYVDPRLAASHLKHLIWSIPGSLVPLAVREAVDQLLPKTTEEVEWYPEAEELALVRYLLRLERDRESLVHGLFSLSQLILAGEQDQMTPWGLAVVLPVAKLDEVVDLGGVEAMELVLGLSPWPISRIGRKG
ncbi:hypothetical protein BJ684DRAFT_16071 [Piptocephalis cylindrospora]|uniref:Uncharacterized protein n=1 Tax=Piptocephalis cylindrospora TaxID=1907219 RepID=A0A4P9Y5Q8_9FUNG|nr:hypothetical protein BJ684DRAFT_16071 [Piptocephalis cylindrospora]|eukprot:RKP13541.1 hypothetical protein BJ684DRAFT_16071 [Piptocephalis cylindrospora]